MMILLRVLVHAILIMLAFNILALSIQNHHVPVLKGLLAWIQWQGFSLFSLSCALVLNRQLLLLFALLVLVLLCYLDEGVQAMLPLFTAAGLGLAFGQVLAAIVQQARPPAPPPPGGPHA